MSFDLEINTNKGKMSASQLKLCRVLDVRQVNTGTAGLYMGKYYPNGNFTVVVGDLAGMVAAGAVIATVNRFVSGGDPNLIPTANFVRNDSGVWTSTSSLNVRWSAYATQPNNVLEIATIAVGV